MPVNLQKFLSAAQDAVIPDAANVARLNELFSQVVATISVDRQARSLEYGFGALTLTTTSTPVFSFVNSDVTTVYRYHHLGIHASAVNARWVADVQYPGLPGNFTVSRGQIATIQAPPLGNATALLDLIRKVVNPADTTSAGLELAYKPLDIFPRGDLRVYSEADEISGSVFQLGFLRERLSILNSIQLVTGKVAGFQA